MQIQDRVGQQFGHYRLLRLIGTGGYAEVYLAEHIHLSSIQHAIKVLLDSDLKDYQREEFLTEAQTIANLQRLNDHIVQIFDFGIKVDEHGTADSGIPYFVMEYASEGTLRHLYPHGTQVPLERILLYIKQVAEALQCAHNLTPPIVHCDIKPENMLLRSLDHVLLSDFGIAITGQTGPLVQSQSNGVVGTAVYTAPERFSSHTRRASDQYSLGIIVYEWLCGHPPFTGTNMGIYAKHLFEQPALLCPTYPHVTREIDDVVGRALAKTPEDRYPSVEEFARALEGAIQSSLRQKRPLWQPTGSIEKENPYKIALQDQQHRLQGAYPHSSPFDSMDTLTSRPTQQVSLLMKPAAPPGAPVRPATVTRTTHPFQEMRGFFAFSAVFAHDRRYGFFRDAGVVLNVLGAGILGLLLWSVYPFFLGMIFSLLMFRLCIRAVEGKLAMFFGILVTLYWGGVGWVIGRYVPSPLNLSRIIPAIFLSLVFFGISLGAHAWYVARKNL